MEISGKCKIFVDQITEQLNIGDNDEINTVRKNVLRFINDSFNEKITAESGELCYVAADLVTAEIIDGETGLCFRRELPVRYEETGNGISLIGEDIRGKEAQISFLSEAAFEKIKDLTGKGPDKPVCGTHDH